MKDPELHNTGVVLLNSLEMLLSFVLEDFVQVGLQYFYFEKFFFLVDNWLIYINAGFMIVKAIKLTVRALILIKREWNKDEALDGFNYSRLLVYKSSFIEFVSKPETFKS